MNMLDTVESMLLLLLWRWADPEKIMSNEVETAELLSILWSSLAKLIGPLRDTTPQREKTGQSDS